ncbi:MULTISPECIES: acylphosphatase [Sinobaca]|uniref:acylphosphatase n=1 Tax=Sinobaca qinghaiensis TaxID=342944 RepID=A0A419V3U0_9BACL|nr:MULTISPECIES: acylphosphatase [Sinobaca]RKD73173.1 acylphosphatase [Sinobaca qinghaiensis]
MKQHIIVHGLVQGVGFRQFTKMEADKLSIYGWVHNKTDNTVEIAAEGDDKAMRSFLTSVEKGPRFSKVDKIEVNPIDEVDHKQSFKVK